VCHGSQPPDRPPIAGTAQQSQGGRGIFAEPPVLLTPVQSAGCVREVADRSAPGLSAWWPCHHAMFMFTRNWSSIKGASWRLLSESGWRSRILERDVTNLLTLLVRVSPVPGSMATSDADDRLWRTSFRRDVLSATRRRDVQCSNGVRPPRAHRTRERKCTSDDFSGF
jgi:hypothetical protein